MPSGCFHPCRLPSCSVQGGAGQLRARPARGSRPLHCQGHPRTGSWGCQYPWSSWSSAREEIALCAQASAQRHQPASGACSPLSFLPTRVFSVLTYPGWGVRNGRRLQGRPWGCSPRPSLLWALDAQVRGQRPSCQNLGLSVQHWGLGDSNPRKTSSLTQNLPPPYPTLPHLWALAQGAGARGPSRAEGSPHFACGASLQCLGTQAVSRAFVSLGPGAVARSRPGS